MTKTSNTETTTEDDLVVNGELVNPSPVPERVMPMSLDAPGGMPPARKPLVKRKSASLPLEVMLDVPVTLIFEVGRTIITIKQLMELCKGSYVELRNVSVDSIDVRMNDKIIAQADTIALPQRYGIRFGEVELFQGRSYKSYRGMGSIAAMQKGSSDRYFQAESADEKLVPEGVEGRVPYKGPLTNTIHQLLGGVRSSMGYVGCRTIDELRTRPEFVKVTHAGMAESHVHDVTITKEAPNYQV